MALRAYKHFRIYITKNSGHTSGYISVNEFRLYGEADHSGVDLCQGSTVTADTQYSVDMSPPKAIDGNPATSWESSNVGLPHWLKVELPEPAQVRSFYLSSTAYPKEVPVDFSLQGSDDGLTWSDVSVFKDWSPAGTVKSAYEKTNVFVGGVSKLDTGARSSRVLLHNWVTGTHVATVFPGDDGVWSYQTRFSDDLLITHIGPVGFQPVSDGPVTPFVG